MTAYYRLHVYECWTQSSGNNIFFCATCSPSVWDGRQRGGESGGCPVLLLHLWRRGGRLPRPGPTQQEDPQPEHLVGRQLLGVQVGVDHHHWGVARKLSCPELMDTRLVSCRFSTAQMSLSDWCENGNRLCHLAKKDGQIQVHEPPSFRGETTATHLLWWVVFWFLVFFKSRRWHFWNPS